MARRVDGIDTKTPSGISQTTPEQYRSADDFASFRKHYRLSITWKTRTFGAGVRITLYHHCPVDADSGTIRFCGGAVRDSSLHPQGATDDFCERMLGLKLGDWLHA